MAAADIRYKSKPRTTRQTTLHDLVPLLVVAVVCFLVVALDIHF